MSAIKIKKLVIKNVGMIADTTVELDKPLILFYGEIRQGKSTILNAIRWVFGGEFPSDIIRHGEKEALVELHFDGGIIERSWYVAKDKTTKARAVAFVRSGKPVPSPVSEIKRFLNPFLLDQDHLARMTELERKRYFADLFAVDTTAINTELFNLDREASGLRSKISGYGEIDTTPVDAPADEKELRAALDKINGEHTEACEKVTRLNSEVDRHDNEFTNAEKSARELEEQIAKLETELKEKRVLLGSNRDWRVANPRRTHTANPVKPDTTELETKLSRVLADKVSYDQFQKNVTRQKEKEADQDQLSTKEAKMRQLRKDKLAALKKVSETSGIKGLSFDEEGNFSYDNTQAGMLSTSQIMQLSSELSALYPEGFGIGLIDRGESLGKSIFEFVDRAKAEDKTILATIVGEAPATVPEHVGVFVVENGNVNKK